MRIKIILVDDHPLVREGINSMLQLNEQIEVVARYAGTSELLNGLKKCTVDLILLDLQLKEGNSDGVIPVIKEQYPLVKIVILSSNDNIHNIKLLLNKGVDGYLLKDTEQKELIRAIKDVCDEEKEKPIVSVEVANQLKKLAYKDHLFFNSAQHLTPREKEVLQLIAQELTSQEIGERLHLSQRTVESYRLMLMQKLDVKNMVGMVKKAIMLGLVKQ